MKKLLLSFLVAVPLMFGFSGSANATVPCIVAGGSGQQAGHCRHWPDANRASQTVVPVRVYGTYNTPFGVDGSTFASAWGNSGCNPGSGNFAAMCGELLRTNPTISYHGANCPIGAPMQSIYQGVGAIVHTCIGNYGVLTQPQGYWSCGSPPDIWVGCAIQYIYYVWENGAWQYSAHIAEAQTWIDTSIYLTNNGQPNYDQPYHYRAVVKQELGCHEAVGHSFGGNHGPTTNCLQVPLPDSGNPNALYQTNRPFLYDAAASIDSWHNHNDAGFPDAAIAASVKGSSSLAYQQAREPWKYLGKKGVKVVVTKKPVGKPKLNVVYVARMAPEPLLAAPMKPVYQFKGMFNWLPKDDCAVKKNRALHARGKNCGGSYPQHTVYSGPGYCFIATDWGPGTSPRYTQRPCF